MKLRSFVYPDRMDKKRPYTPHLLLFCLLLLTACQRPIPTSVSPNLGSGTTPPEATKGEGYSRTRPYPPDQTVQTSNWQATVNQYLRGSAAWEALAAQANSLNKPPTPGEEYVLVSYTVQYTGSQTAEDAPLHLHLTGAENINYFSHQSGVYPPDYLDSYELRPGESTTGWLAYRIAADEPELMVVVDELFTDGEPLRYVALESDAAMAVPRNELQAIEPTAYGRTPLEPAFIGQTVTSEDWQITIHDVIMGEDAWPTILEANQFNDPPAKGSHYLLVRVTARYLGLTETGVNLDAFDFDLQGVDGQLYDIPPIVDPEPDLDYRLYPGGEVTGWMTLQASEDDSELTLIFQPDFARDDANTRYFSLLRYGR